MTIEKVFIHAVWCTKNRYPYLNSKEIRQKVWAHIRMYAVEQNLKPISIGGYSDHCHCLFQLPPIMTFSKCIQLLKGESSNWINKSNICHEKFRWQNDYFAISVSESALANTARYICFQENHHKKMTFESEYNAFIKHQ